MSSSVFGLLIEAVESHKNETALMYESRGRFKELCWKEVYDNVLTVASSLLDLGVEPKERVAIMSKTRMEWSFLDLGVLAVSAVSVPLYASINDDDFLFILKE